MAFVGYHMGLDGEAQAIAAAPTYNEAFGKTLERVADLYQGNLLGLMSSQMAVEEKPDLTDEQAAEFERIYAEVRAKWEPSK